jgi:hypothetical protein
MSGGRIELPVGCPAGTGPAPPARLRLPADLRAGRPLEGNSLVHSCQEDPTAGRSRGMSALRTRLPAETDGRGPMAAPPPIVGAQGRHSHAGSRLATRTVQRHGSGPARPPRLRRARRDLRAAGREPATSSIRRWSGRSSAATMPTSAWRSRALLASSRSRIRRRLVRRAAVMDHQDAGQRLARWSIGSLDRRQRIMLRTSYRDLDHIDLLGGLPRQLTGGPCQGRRRPPSCTSLAASVTNFARSGQPFSGTTRCGSPRPLPAARPGQLPLAEATPSTVRTSMPVPPTRRSPPIHRPPLRRASASPKNRRPGVELKVTPR